MSIVTDPLEIQRCHELTYLVKTYQSINKTITSTKNRLRSIHPEITEKAEVERLYRYDPMLGGEEETRRQKDGDGETIVKVQHKGLESVKGTCSRKIERALDDHKVWTEWAQHVPGCGSISAGTFLCLWSWRSTPICKDCGGELVKADGMHCCVCGKEAKKDGVMKHRIESRDYPNISKWHAYLGLHNVNGVKPKRQKGELANWSTVGRTTAHLLGRSFIKTSAAKSLYRAYYDKRRAERDITHPTASDGHKLNMAANETVKLFLSHWWQVARTLEGKPLTDPYPIQIMGHTGIIPPYYWPKGQ